MTQHQDSLSFLPNHLILLEVERDPLERSYVKFLKLLMPPGKGLGDCPPLSLSYVAVGAPRGSICSSDSGSIHLRSPIYWLAGPAPSSPSSAWLGPPSTFYLFLLLVFAVWSVYNHLSVRLQADLGKQADQLASLEWENAGRKEGPIASPVLHYSTERMCSLYSPQPLQCL